MESTRRRAPNYPLMVGLISLISLIIVWNLPEGEHRLLTDAGPPSDGGVDARAGDAEAAVPLLSWTLEGATLPDQATLADCLRGGGWDRIRVLGGGARPLSVTHGSVTLSVAAAAGGVEVRTPLFSGRHLAVSLHGAVAACAGAQATTLVDPLTGRHPDKSTWPTARREAGLPLPLLVKTVPGATWLASQGLERLGLFDVLLVGADTPHHRRVVERAAVAVLLADDAEVAQITLGERTVSLARSEVPWWPAGAPHNLRALGDAAGPFVAPAWVEPPAGPRPAPRSAPATARPAQPPSVPRRALPTTPLFKPEYR